MEQTSCLKLLFASEVGAIVKAIEGIDPDIRAHEIPSLEALLDSKEFVDVPVPRYSQAENDPIVVLHSSGSTGKRKGPAHRFRQRF